MSVKCRPYFRRVPKFRSHAAMSWNIRDLCKAYSWPAFRLGGTTIAIIELGGGWNISDIVLFSQITGMPVPRITDVSVDGTQNSKQNPANDADIEVALDIEVAATAYWVATGLPANIRVYWSQDIASAVKAAALDGCGVCSISWGADEADWGPAEAGRMAHVAKKASAQGMTIFAASGDNNSSDGGPDAANVDCPASCPQVIACGGTTKTRFTETVWNNSPGNSNGEGTGGGYSTLFTMPRHQYRQLPWFTAKRGRMLPDIVANADPTTGYQIIVYGRQMVIGGTSAVSPLMSGLFASFGKKLGLINHKLWWNERYFRDVTQGDNGLYTAGVGPDPCSGLGVPTGNFMGSVVI